jgi:soluble lytic murein transglycosylase-like protein
MPQADGAMLKLPARAALLLTLALSGPGAGLAGVADPAELCLDAARRASEASGVPLRVLLAIALVETGRAGRPWPWTVNLGGDGQWLDSAAEAEALAADAVATGRTNVDLGCFQLNLRWHGEAFASLADMLDPGQNAAYAADFLARHYGETGDWAAAAAAYHSATPEHADRYRARFETVLASLDPAPEMPGPSVLTPRRNSFPLLVAGQAGRNGSLVPVTGGGLRLIGGN